MLPPASLVRLRGGGASGTRAKDQRPGGAIKASKKRTGHDRVITRPGPTDGGLLRGEAIRRARVQAKRRKDQRHLEGSSATDSDQGQAAAPWKPSKRSWPAPRESNLGTGGGWASLLAPKEERDDGRPCAQYHSHKQESVSLRTADAAVVPSSTGHAAHDAKRPAKSFPSDDGDGDFRCGATASAVEAVGVEEADERGDEQAGRGEPEKSRYMSTEVRRALKRRRRHYSSGSMKLHQSLSQVQNVFDLLALLSVRMISLEMGDYREKWVDPMPFFDYKGRLRSDLMQRLVSHMDAANVAIVLKHLSVLEPTAAHSTTFAQYRQLPLLFAELLVRIGNQDVADSLMPSGLLSCWAALARLRGRPQVTAHLGRWCPQRSLYGLVDAGASRANASSSSSSSDETREQVVAITGYDPLTTPFGVPGVHEPTADGISDASAAKHGRAQVRVLRGGLAATGHSGGNATAAGARRQSCMVALARATDENLTFASLTDRQLAKVSLARC